jgi:hypothetical protein
MKLFAILSLSVLLLLGSTGTALAQETKPVQEKKPVFAPQEKNAFGQENKKKCPFDIVGTWKAQISTTEARLYRFDAEGVLKVLKVSGAAQPQEIASTSYELVDNSNTPDQISFLVTGKNKIFGKSKAPIKVVGFDDSSMTCEIPGAGTIRWTREDPNRYFIVFAARQGEFYDNSGSAFPMVIKLAGGVPKIDAAGTYSVAGKTAFGTVPPDAYKNYLREARGDSEVILRLEINSRQYGRALKVVQEWQRRVREDALLYRSPDGNVAFNNILLIRAVTETLNLCQNDFDLYKLDYVHPTDWISNIYGPEFIPFFFFKELRRRNEARHIGDKQFQELVPMSNMATR